jgi:hypothetical protein
VRARKARPKILWTRLCVGMSCPPTFVNSFPRSASSVPKSELGVSARMRFACKARLRRAMIASRNVPSTPMPMEMSV